MSTKKPNVVGDKLVISSDTHLSQPKHIVVDLPSNSHKSRTKTVEVEEEKTRKPLEKVVTGKTVLKKKSMFSKVKSMFVGEDGTTVSSYILYDVLIPAAKATITDMVSTGIEMLMFGEARTLRSRSQGKPGMKPYVNYGLYSVGKAASTLRDSEPRYSKPVRDIENIICETKADAIEVISRMRLQIQEYQTCSVADLNSLLGQTGNYTDEKIGWDDLSNVQIIRQRDGYLLVLPRVKVID